MSQPTPPSDEIAEQITKIYKLLTDKNIWTRAFNLSMAELSIILLLIHYARKKAGVTESSITASRTALAALGPQYEWPLHELLPETKETQPA